MKSCIILLLLFIYLTQTHTCPGGGGGWGGQEEKEVKEKEKKPPKKTKGYPYYDPYYNFEGFERPNGTMEFEEFMAAYNKSLIERAKASGDYYGRDIPADAGADWPANWIGVGIGNDGVPPPPWSYMPLNTGKAAYCNKAPDKGDCGEDSKEDPKEVRWGYNPFMDECRQFMYSGCLGNQNNFRTKLRCEQACFNAQFDGCDLQSHIPVGQLKRKSRRACPLTDQQLSEHTVRDYSNVGSL